MDASDALGRALDASSLEALFDGVTDAVLFVKDAQGRYVVVNHTLAKRCRKRAKRDVLGRTPRELFPDDLGSGYAEQDRQVLECGVEIHERLEVHFYPDGTRGWCLTHKVPLHDDAGRPAGLIGMSRDLREPDRPGTGLREVAWAAEYLQEHYAEEVRVEDVAARAGLPVDRLQRLFRRVFRITPLQLLIQTRLRAASRLLADTEDSVTEIAHACGYAEHSAFTRRFRAAVGLPPLAFRRSARAAEPTHAHQASPRRTRRARTLRVLVAEGVDETLFRLGADARPGFEREILQGFARQQGLELITVALSRWCDLLPALEQEEGDLIAGGYSVTPSRRRRIAFSSEALPTRIVALSYPPHPAVTSLAELRRATVGVARGSSMQEEALRQGVPPRGLREEAGFSAADLGALRAHRVTVVLADLHSALLARARDPRVQMGVFVGARGSLAFGLRRGEVGLRAALDGHLAQLRRRGEWERLVMSYWHDAGATLLQGA